MPYAFISDSYSSALPLILVLGANLKIVKFTNVLFKMFILLYIIQLFTGIRIRQ